MIIYTNKNTNKKCGKCKNWMEQLGNSKLIKTCVYKVLLLDCGIIWNNMKYECGGGGGNRTRVLLSFQLRLYKFSWYFSVSSEVLATNILNLKYLLNSRYCYGGLQ